MTVDSRGRGEGGLRARYLGARLSCCHAVNRVCISRSAAVRSIGAFVLSRRPRRKRERRVPVNVGQATCKGNTQHDDSQLKAKQQQRHAAARRPHDEPADYGNRARTDSTVSNSSRSEFAADSNSWRRRRHRPISPVSQSPSSFESLAESAGEFEQTDKFRIFVFVVVVVYLSAVGHYYESLQNAPDHSPSVLIVNGVRR
uniref:Transmembrane protein n=1 Tax=Plectus sambesii TaxID=2011161 RepID=A0A914W6X4_9BILA